MVLLLTRSCGLFAGGRFACPSSGGRRRRRRRSGSTCGRWHRCGWRVGGGGRGFTGSRRVLLCRFAACGGIRAGVRDHGSVCFCVRKVSGRGRGRAMHGSGHARHRPGCSALPIGRAQHLRDVAHLPRVLRHGQTTRTARMVTRRRRRGRRAVRGGRGRGGSRDGGCGCTGGGGCSGARAVEVCVSVGSRRRRIDLQTGAESICCRPRSLRARVSSAGARMR